MKNKKTLLMMSLLSNLLIAMTGCNKSSTITIGILQPVEHDALSAARLRFIEGLKEEGFIDGKNIKIIYQNANGVASEQSSLAKSLTSKCDLTLGIGTGAAQSLQSAQINSGSSKPILFTAVTDPVFAKLVESNEHPGGFVTGTSDANPVAEQINLMIECVPNIDKIGIMYTQSETNSEVQALQAKKTAEEKGIEVVIETCTDSTDINTVANHLCETNGLDAIYIPTDNNIAANMNAIKLATDRNHVLSVCGEEGLLKNGGHITLSISYKNLGIKTAKMAVDIINGKNPKDISVLSSSIDECEFVINEESLKSANITIPNSIIEKCRKI